MWSYILSGPNNEKEIVKLCNKLILPNQFLNILEDKNENEKLEKSLTKFPRVKFNFSVTLLIDLIIEKIKEWFGIILSLSPTCDPSRRNSLLDYPFYLEFYFIQPFNWSLQLESDKIPVNNLARNFPNSEFWFVLSYQS